MTLEHSKAHGSLMVATWSTGSPLELAFLVSKNSLQANLDKYAFWPAFLRLPQHEARCAKTCSYYRLSSGSSFKRHQPCYSTKIVRYRWRYYGCYLDFSMVIFSNIFPD